MQGVAIRCIVRSRSQRIVGRARDGPHRPDGLDRRCGRIRCSTRMHDVACPTMDGPPIAGAIMRSASVTRDRPMNAPERLHDRRSPSFKWDDPLLLDEQLTRGGAHGARRPRTPMRRTSCCRASRKRFATRRPTRRSFRRWARSACSARRFRPSTAAPASTTSATGLIAREIERVDSGYRSMMSVQSSLVMYPDLHLRQRSAAAQVPAEARDRRMDRLLRPDRARPRLRSRLDGDARAQRRRRLQAVRRQDVDLATRRSPTCSSCGRRTTTASIRGFILEKGMKGLSAPKIEGKFCLRASITGEIVMDDVFVPDENLLPNVQGLEGPVRLPQQRALRHRVGRAGRRRVLLARGAAVHARPQAVRPAARREPADPEEARRHADRDHARAAGLPAARAAEGRGQGGAGDHVDHEAQLAAARRSRSRAWRATCTAATASSTSST